MKLSFSEIVVLFAVVGAAKSFAVPRDGKFKFRSYAVAHTFDADYFPFRAVEEVDCLLKRSDGTPTYTKPVASPPLALCF